MTRSKTILRFVGLGLVLLIVFATSMAVSIVTAGVVGEFAGKAGFWIALAATMLATMLLLGKFVVQPFYAIAATEGVSAEKGRSILVAYFVVILLLAATNVLTSAFRGLRDVLESLVSPAVAIVLFFWVYQGSKGAKWLLVVGCVLLGGFIAVLTTVFLLKGASAVVLLPGGMAAAFLSFAVVLVTSRSVAAFLESQRQRTNAP